MATTSRSITKSLTYRILMLLINGIIVYLFTGSFSTARDIAIVLAVVGTLVYFLHERIWSSVQWGKSPSAR